MKRLLHVLEPLIWGPFVTGNFFTPLVFPALILVVGILVPLGMVPAEALSYERLHGMITTPIGGLITVLGILVVLPLALLSGAHHLRHVSIDMGKGEQDPVVAPLMYGVFGIGSLVVVLGIIRLFFD